MKSTLARAGAAAGTSTPRSTATASTRHAMRHMLFERMKLDAPEEHFRTLGLNEDRPFRERTVPAFVHLHPVQEIDDAPAVHDRLHPVPLAHGLLGVLRP